uniref:Uncharacterized protein n=1 Tax=Timema tahoe TaxID=61484 RepID=A0A7R9IRP5_9NEOP|nr:unnamed protein product [Timema tahoe]
MNIDISRDATCHAQLYWKLPTTNSGGETALVAFTMFRLVLVWVVPCCVYCFLQVIPYHCGDLDDDNDSSENEGLALQICVYFNDFRQRPKYHQHNVRKIPAPSGRNAKRLSRGQKASRSERSIRPSQPPPPPPLVKSGSEQSLKSRRQLANLLYLQVSAEKLPAMVNTRINQAVSSCLIFFCDNEVRFRIPDGFLRSGSVRGVLAPPRGLRPARAPQSPATFSPSLSSSVMRTRPCTPYCLHSICFMRQHDN